MAVARVSGEIDASNAKWLEERLRAPLTNRADGLVVDLTATTYLDSAGIALLFGLASALRQHQQQLRLVVADGSPIARMVRLTGLDRRGADAPDAGGGARGAVGFHRDAAISELRRRAAGDPAARSSSPPSTTRGSGGSPTTPRSSSIRSRSRSCCAAGATRTRSWPRACSTTASRTPTPRRSSSSSASAPRSRRSCARSPSRRRAAASPSARRRLRAAMADAGARLARRLRRRQGREGARAADDARARLVGGRAAPETADKLHHYWASLALLEGLLDERSARQPAALRARGAGHAAAAHAGDAPGRSARRVVVPPGEELRPLRAREAAAGDRRRRAATSDAGRMSHTYARPLA